MTWKHALAAIAVMAMAMDEAWSQSAYPGSPGPTATSDPWTPKVAKPRPKPTAAAKPTGMCTIMRDGKINDQQSCAAIRPSAAGENLYYVWPSGTRTTIGGTDEDFTVNGNMAAPRADDELGLCLAVEKTGNTFCYKEGAKPSKIESVTAEARAPNPAPAAPATAPAAPAASAAPAPAPVQVVAGAATPSAAATPPNQDQVKLKEAEDKIQALEAEVTRLKEAEAARAEAVRLAQAEVAKREEEAKKNLEAEQSRAASVLNEIEVAQKRCAAREASECDRALQLMNEAVVTGNVDINRRRELERLKTIARAPFGLPSLSFLSDVPVSTMLASMLAALLAISHLRSRQRNLRSEPVLEDARISPTLNRPNAALTPPPLPSSAPAQLPSPSGIQLSEKISSATANPALMIDPSSVTWSALAEPPPPPAPSTALAYTLNLILPGSGNAYFGQSAFSALLLAAIAAAVVSPFAGPNAMSIGICLAALSLAMAFFTSGASLFIGIPAGLLLVLSPATSMVSVAIWIFCVGAAQVLVYRRTGLRHG